ncbi:MAG: FAD-dependent oxidoreductase, partial [Silvanigrellales bacterium]|nr:FAD-dependent oxidoreductase [Silvanigrellales bacterium]
MRRRRLIALMSLAALASGCRYRPFNDSSGVREDFSSDLISSESSPRQRSVECQIIIAGGTTAASAAALAAAKEFDESGSGTVCLLEPTNWPGGQLSASGVPAVDFDHHTRDKSGENTNIGTLAANHTLVFAKWMQAMGRGGDTAQFTMDSNPGRCWVSVRCFQPESMVYTLFETMRPYVEKGRLKVFLSTVVKSTTTSGRKITAVKGIVRTPKDPKEKGTWDERTWETGVWQAGAADDLTAPALQRKFQFGIYSKRLSSVLENWYSEAEDDSYSKEIVTFLAVGKNPVVIDATEWGEVLALSNARYDIGIEGNENCGQAIIFPLAMQLTATPWTPHKEFLNALNEVRPEMKALYSHRGGGGNWDMNWRYRRMDAASQSRSVWRAPPTVGDLSQINVNEGNDYTLEYLFPTKAETKALVEGKKWNGGVKIRVLKNAETHSFGYANYMRETFEEGKKQALAAAAGQSW